MDRINLQSKTTAEEGKAEKYWFENQNIGLKRTLFHRVYVPLSEFNSGLAYEEQPVNTRVIMEWMDLNLRDSDDLDGVNITSTPEDQIEVSIYLGSAHNPCDIDKMNWKRIGTNRYLVNCQLRVDFEYEGVAQNEVFNFETEVILDTKTKEN